MPDKSPDAFRTISEVADWLGVQPHVLRFWESKFSQVRPVKRAGGRRYYRPNDMLLLGGIRKLLHEDGLTIKGAQKVLREEGMSHVARLSQPLDAESAALSDLVDGRDMPADERDAAPMPPAEEAAEETGNVLSFGVPQPGSEAVKPADEEALRPSRPELSKTSAPTAEAPGPSATDAEGHSGTREEPEETDAPMPSFRRSPSRKPSEAERSDGETQEPKLAASDKLPSFLQQSGPMAEPGDAAPDMPRRHGSPPGEATDPSTTPKSQTSAAPKPRIVEAPDPDESAIDAAPGALSACHARLRLTADQRAEILPLVAQLAALLDRMATSRGR